MIEKSLICPICGYQFVPGEHPGCTQCPLHKNCVMICCPSCGYSIILPEESTIGKWYSKLFRSKKSKEENE